MRSTNEHWKRNAFEMTSRAKQWREGTEVNTDDAVATLLARVEALLSKPEEAGSSAAKRMCSASS